MNESLPATRRYAIRSAPEGLRLVQDLLNTRAIGDRGDPDLLGDVALANDWFTGVMAEWGESTGKPRTTAPLTAVDLRRLRDLRRVLVKLVGERGVLDERDRAVLAAPASLATDARGRITIEPPSGGWRSLASLLLGEMMLAQAHGTWDRLKLCRNPLCASAFYDTSKNKSAAWHDVHTCGNAINLRASRARRRLAHEPGDQE